MFMNQTGNDINDMLTLLNNTANKVNSVLTNIQNNLTPEQKEKLSNELEQIKKAQNDLSKSFQDIENFKQQK